ncbi:GNAT family N-acetyltransferase [Chryseobacterium shigense]|uniref:Ribosomal-protein-alanine N-acetyltransferase n=1 Tax=Chryseobacterium shigense TaxID=297244 RepID=A0A1N7HZJ4_9FLAO|nr:GNAT family N-acetyltransferase [Chryseobacterium shigense]PQA90933.1 GNAT family N-acetyltransferase [Chryseobacterium shigense]SIS30253.1 ribosomal-protein-alanine N-acetyltransferase [Chryseobacterium shigense]
MKILHQDQNFVIRHFLVEELQWFCDLFHDDEVTKYLPYRSPEQYKEMFHIALHDYTQGPFGRFGIFDAQNNDFIGMCLVRNFADRSGQVEIGYTLSKKYWGKGIATEVSRALIKYCLDNTLTNEIVAVTDLDNIGSQKVLEKAGFSRIPNLKRAEGELAYYLVKRH